jgi:hypothetical protein
MPASRQKNRADARQKRPATHLRNNQLRTSDLQIFS